MVRRQTCLQWLTYCLFKIKKRTPALISTVIENYLKQIRLETTRPGGGNEGLCAMGRLAQAVGVTPGTATTMAKSMAEMGLVIYEPRGGVRLTEAGQQVADRILRRHRVVELFLVEILGMDWAEVHDEAEELEHAVSDKVLERIDALLDHPTVDPHGSPIPRAGDAWEVAERVDLTDCAIEKALTLVRMVDHDAAFLRYAERCGLVPGASIQVVERLAGADTVRVNVAGVGEVTLS